MAKIKTKCSKCEDSSWGHYDPCSDICDGCMCDPHVAWFGFYDHRVGRDFNTEEEQRKFYQENEIID